MPVAVSGIIAAVAGTSAIGVALQSALGLITIAGGTLVGGVVLNLALSAGLSYLAAAIFRPGINAPKPEDVQQSYRQPAAPRTRHYGRVKASGPWLFAEAEQGRFHKVVALGEGPIDAIEQFWIDDTQVTLDVDGWVQEEPWGGGDRQEVRILSRLGETPETYYSQLGDVFPEWTSDHRGDGIASLYALQMEANQSRYLRRFPNGINTSYRVVLRGARVWNPVTGITEWDDNAASIIRDYMTHADGMRLPVSIFTKPLAQAGWEEAFNRADVAIPLKAGGSEPRYRLWGSYRLDERPADVIGRMLQCCDGRLVPTPDGGLTLDIGKWEEPSVTLDTDAITGFSELGKGRDILSTSNTIRATFLDPDQDYQAADADPWVNADDVSARGEITQDMQFNMAPSHSQCRRLMKLASYRANPTWVATFQCNLRALAAFGERFVRISYPPFGINSVFEVMDFRFIIGERNLVTGVTLQVQSMPQAAYEWDPEQEEGDAPVSDESEPDDTIPVPDPPTVTFQAGPVAELTFSPSSSVLLFYQARWKKTADTEWTESDVMENDAASFTTPTLDAATEYEFQLRFVTEKGIEGDWSASTVDTTP